MNFGNNYRRYQRNNFKNYKQQNPTAIKEREITTTFNKNTAQREPLKCWECGEPHYFKYYLVRKKCLNNIHTILEATTVEDIARSMPIINATL